MRRKKARGVRAAVSALRSGKPREERKRRGRDTLLPSEPREKLPASGGAERAHSIAAPILEEMGMPGVITARAVL